MPPPTPFEPMTETLLAGSELYRVFTAGADRFVDTFNPGTGHQAQSRFAFFGDPVVPVLYAAGTEVAAVCETILHDIPLTGGRLLPEDFLQRVVGLVRPTRDLRLASFRGLGLRRLGVEQGQVTATSGAEFGTTVKWAEAAHAYGFDGIVWMSYRCNSDAAFILFGDRVEATDLETESSYGRLFATGPDLDCLIDLCAAARVEVMLPRS